MNLTKCFLSLIALLIAGHCYGQSAYKIANKFPVEGDGGWDFLIADDSTGRLFVSHGTEVNVVDEKTGRLLGTIPDKKGVHGIAIARDFNKGFISDGKDTAVTVFDLKTLVTLVKVKVTGMNPDAILYDRFSRQVFVFNGKSSNATVIDCRTNKIAGTITLEGKPEVAVSDEKGKVYVNIEDKSKICVLNTTTLQVEQSWSIAPGEEPSGLANDLENHRLFSVCSNKLMVVVNAQTGKVITTLPIGNHQDGAAFDAGNKRAYSSNGDGSLTVVQQISADKYKVLENVPTQKGAKTIALDSQTHHIFLSTAEFGDTPAATKENPKPRPSVKPGTFVILDIEPVN